MALTTQSFPNKIKEEVQDPEYEIITDAEGKKALKKIRKVEDLKVQEVDTEELKPQKIKRSRNKKA